MKSMYCVTMPIFQQLNLDLNSVTSKQLIPWTIHYLTTLPRTTNLSYSRETTISPENLWLEDEIVLQNGPFSGDVRSFSEG